MITLCHRPKTRSSRFVFLLEELEAPYRIELSPAGHAGNPHPHDKVPAIMDGDVPVFESSAIALYLTDRFPKNGLGPRVDDPQRGAYLTWLAYYCGVMEPAWVMKFVNVTLPPTMPGWPPVEQVMAHTMAALAKGPYLLGDRFSAADVLVGTTFALFMGSPMLPPTPELEAYVQRVIGRPAYARAMRIAGDVDA